MAIFNKGLQGSDNLANQGLILDFYSVHTGKSVSFKAFIKDFSDSFDSKWNTDHVFGRNDPIATFQGTSRRISLSWTATAASMKEAEENLKRISDLVKMLYPAYAGTSPGTLSTSPAFRVRFGNLISGGPDGFTASQSGLFCFITSFNSKPQIENGFYISGQSTQGSREESRNGVFYYPKIIDLSCQLNIVHEHPVGFQGARGAPASQKFARFPYQIRSSTMVSEAQPQNQTPGANANPDIIDSDAAAAANAVLSSAGTTTIGTAGVTGGEVVAGVSPGNSQPEMKIIIGKCFIGNELQDEGYVAANQAEHGSDCRIGGIYNDSRKVPTGILPGTE